MSASKELSFRPIDLERHLDEVIAFRVDSYVCSFGEIGREKFHKDNGPDGRKYLDWLTAKIQRDPNLAVHVWQGDRIIGQMELDALRTDPTIGYINLYYLIPKVRGTGVSKSLDDYAVRFLKSKGHTKARLSVSPSNPRAIRYYQRMGWVDLGQRADVPDVNFMEKSL